MDPLATGTPAPSEGPPRRVTTVLVAGIDTVREKNLHQLLGLADRGYRFVVLTTDALGRSRELLAGAGNVEVHTAHRFWFRSTMLVALLRVLFTRRIDVAEVYPYAELPLLMTIILRLARVPVAVIARGQEFYYVTRRMSLRRRLTFRWTYALAPHVIYKEPYMKDMLDAMGKRHVWFLPNAAEVPRHVVDHRPDKCHLLFLNAANDRRHPITALRAFLKLCAERRLDRRAAVRLSIVGLRRSTRRAAEAAQARELEQLVADRDVPVELHDWTDRPERWLDDADVFLLPADVVFLNYSLLEAMARGVPPIVQATPGSDLIIEHGVNGYALPGDVDAWQAHMRMLIDDWQLRRRLGAAARQTVLRRYSIARYLERYDAIYRQILHGPGQAPPSAAGLASAPNGPAA